MGQHAIMVGMLKTFAYYGFYAAHNIYQIINTWYNYQVN